jgi:tetratricopeptide (TPR) repeat protein
MRLEFHEALGDVLDQRNLKPAQLAQLIRDKDSMVPKWLRGERVPQIEDVELIASALGLLESEVAHLQAARRYSALKEILRRPKLGLSVGAVEDQLRVLEIRERHPTTLLVPVSIEEELALIRQMRLEGKPMQALGAMDLLKRQLDKDTTALRSRSSAPLVAAYLKERLSLNVNVGAPGTVFASLREDVGQLIELGERFRDYELTAHAYFRAGDAHHLDLNPDAALPYLEKAIRATNDAELKARCMSIMLISIAKRRHIEDKRRYLDLAKRAERLADAARDDAPIGLLWLLNEWGHSFARMGELDAAESTLNEAWRIFEGLEADGLRYKNLELALRRATLIAASKGAYGMSRDELLQTSKDLRDEAMRGNYPRIVVDTMRVEEALRVKEAPTADSDP